jgi:pyruvate-ferredoxin/flavodoxin oxidoreductase
MKKVSDLTGRSYKPFDYVGPPRGRPGCHRHGIFLRNPGRGRGIPEQRPGPKSRPDQSPPLSSFRTGIPVRRHAENGQDHHRAGPHQRARAPWAIRSTDICTPTWKRGKCPTSWAAATVWAPRSSTRHGQGRFDNMPPATPKNHFTVGITDDVTSTSLEVETGFEVAPEGTVASASSGGWAPTEPWAPTSSAIKIIGDNTDMYAQAYFAYDSKKSGGVTISHLRFGKKPDQVHLPHRFGRLRRLPQGQLCPPVRRSGRHQDGRHLRAQFSLEPGGYGKELPAAMRRTIAQKKLKFYNIDAVKIAGGGARRTHQHDHADRFLQTGQRHTGG